MKILVLGIGNVMFGDEGFGAHFVRWVEQSCEFFWDGVRVAGGGANAGENAGENGAGNGAENRALNLNENRAEIAPNSNLNQNALENGAENSPQPAPNSNLDENRASNSNSGATLANSADKTAPSAPSAPHATPATAQNELCFIDGGTLANALSGLIVEFDEVVVVDCIEADDAAVGELFFFPFSAMPRRVRWSGSAHELEMLHTLQMLDLTGELPRTQILAVAPSRVAPLTFELSAPVQAAALTARATLLKYLAGFGISARLAGGAGIQQVANEWLKPQFR